MERIVVNSELNEFLLLDAVMEAGPESMTGRKRFSNAPLCLGIESLAQLGALHVRFLTEFERHAFLLSVKHCKTDSADLLNGDFLLHATLIAHSRSAYSYTLRALSEDAGEGEPVCLEGEFLFATVEYDAVFKKDSLQTHYQRVFSCLKNASKTGC